MNLGYKMTKLTWLNLSLTNNNIEKIELNKWLDWSGNRLRELRLDLGENECGYNDNMSLEDVNCEVYVNIWDTGENEAVY